MSIFGWMLFAFINAIILFFLDLAPDRNATFQSWVLGLTGALSGSLFAYLAVKGVTSEFSITFYLVLAFESVLLLVLFFQKSFRRI